MRDSVLEELIGLVIGTLVLVALDPALAQAFRAPLSDPSFASSAAAPVWGLLGVIFDIHGDIVLMWLGWAMSQLG